MLSKVEKYYEVRDGLRYAPIIDPVFEDLSARRRTAVLGLEPIPFACVHEPHRIDIEPFLKLHPQGELTVPRSTRQGLSEIHRYVQSAYPAYDFNQEDVFRRYRRLKHRERFFRRTFELIRPRIVFMSSFTGWLHAVLAARSLGIPVVDIQHGGQGPSHYPTTHYSRIPSTGYALLPDVFWLWGEMNLSYASPWLPGGADRHIPVVGGNRKVAHWYRRRERGELAEIDRRFIERFSSRAAVLITLSYGVDRLLPESLVEAIRTIPDVDWLVRLHPIHRTPQTVHQVKEHFADLGCSNVFVDEPTDVQLATALSVSFAHISPFSTSGTEATAMGVPTLICHPIGAKLFGAEIASGVLSYADDVDGIAAWVRRCREGASVDEVARRYYVETNDAAVDDIIRVAEAIPAATSDRQMPMTERILNLLGVRAR